MAKPTDLENIVQLTEFVADPDEPFLIQVSQNILVMPIFKWVASSDHWVDASGDYDLCMLKDGITYEFVSRTGVQTKYAYRSIAAFYLSQRLQIPTR